MVNELEYSNGHSLFIEDLFTDKHTGGLFLVKEKENLLSLLMIR